MTTTPLPVVFEPIFKVKPWGGRTLATLFQKPLPPDEPIGESWELVSLPGNESCVKDGPLAGESVTRLLAAWGAALHGTAQLARGRFPLLIKFLDAREHLSVQVHPKPAADDPRGWQPGIKHEAWYVLHADPGAQLYIGLRPDVTLDDLARVANTPATADLLRAWPARTGDCFYLPSGVVHALGAGLVVAEVQTPSDVTYRLYDWDRVDAEGRPRDLHVEQALANVRLDITDEQIVQPRQPVADSFAGAVRATACGRFVIDHQRLAAGTECATPRDGMAMWIVLAGSGVLARGQRECPFRAGDVVLIPADHDGTHVTSREDCELLSVEIPSA